MSTVDVPMTANFSLERPNALPSCPKVFSALCLAVLTACPPSEGATETSPTTGTSSSESTNVTTTNVVTTGMTQDGTTQDGTTQDGTTQDGTTQDPFSSSTSGEVCSQTCGPNEGCFDPPNGDCMCLPGFVLCGVDCVNITVDPSHCGTCNIACGVGVQCISGLCNDLPVPMPTIEAPALASGGVPGEKCAWSTEAKPERSINAGPGTPSYVLAYQRREALQMSEDAFYNWADETGKLLSSLLTASDPPGGTLQATRGQPPMAAQA